MDLTQIRKLKEKRAKLIADAQKIYTDRAEKQEQITAEDRTNFNKIMDDAKIVKTDIDNLEASAAAEAETRETRRPNEAPIGDPSENETKSAVVEYRSALRRHGTKVFEHVKPSTRAIVENLNDKYFLALREYLMVRELSEMSDEGRAIITGKHSDLNALGAKGRIDGPTPASSVLKVLMQAFFFDGVESGGVMRWVPRGLAPKLTIPEADLGLFEDKAKVKPETFAQAHDLPQSFAVLYNDVTLDYQQGRQLKGRNTRIIKTKQQTILEIPMTMTPDWAIQVATKALYLAWLERQTFNFRLARPYYMVLDPTDVIDFVYEGLTFEVRIAEENIGQGFAVELATINSNANNYLSSAAGATGGGFGGGGGILKVAGPTTLILMDIPLVQDADANPGGTGAYAAMSSAVAGWPGAVLEESADDATFVAVPGTATQSAAEFGYATTVLAAPRSPWSWDMVSTVTVRMVVGTPESSTMLAVLNGSNVALLGQELIRYTTVTDNSDGTFTLSGLLRGRRGTEWATSTHAVNEAFVIMPVVRFAEALSILGLELYWAGVTVGTDISSATVQEIELTGQDLMPYAPVEINGSRDGSGNLTIDWTRRTRIGGAWLDGVGVVPVSEDTESYEVDILDGSTVVRTFSVEALSSNSIAAQPTATYSAADQTTDFGSPQASIATKIYQISGEVGKGYPGSATL